MDEPRARIIVGQGEKRSLQSAVPGAEIRIGALLTTLGRLTVIALSATSSRCSSQRSAQASQRRGCTIDGAGSAAGERSSALLRFWIDRPAASIRRRHASASNRQPEKLRNARRVPAWTAGCSAGSADGAPAALRCRFTSGRDAVQVTARAIESGQAAASAYEA
jgi:hypothetical protein